MPDKSSLEPERSNERSALIAPKVSNSVNLVDLPFDDTSTIVIRHIPVSFRTGGDERAGASPWGIGPVYATGLKSVGNAAFRLAKQINNRVALTVQAGSRWAALSKRIALRARSVLAGGARRSVDWSMQMRPVGRLLRDEGLRRCAGLRVGAQDLAGSTRLGFKDWLEGAARKADSLRAACRRRAVQSAAMLGGFSPSRGSPPTRPALWPLAACLAVAVVGGLTAARHWNPQSAPPTIPGPFSQPDEALVKPLARLEPATLTSGRASQPPEPAGLERGLVTSPRPPPNIVAEGAAQESSVVVAMASKGPRPTPSRAPTRSTKREPPNLACQYATTAAEKLVCADRRLQRADRALKSAYDRALAAGVPAQTLEAEHRDWLAMREDAARLSRREVAALYLKRTSHINHLADPPY